ncbi:hypothetical protein WOLCODRAFT_82532 [Wolfiporia cocos MD-104 SS10]|uniref:Reverse transcriptase domain-containing protein n=1 Tax=Wolfiporia cocos (strain MD-104) TaxID=742152 RepID=A0A2H3J311_WOLCO|nr:hypothetical protein WOLCODRAFT_82532 [Wolfiporia cocos MD-104 SS10]
MRPRKPSNRKHSYWWNDDCDHLAHSINHSTHPHQRHIIYKQLCYTTKTAKHTWATHIIEQQQHHNLWSLAKWPYQRRHKHTPPIHTPHGYATTINTKATIFANTYFPPQGPPSHTTLPYDPDPLPTCTYHPVTPHEITNALNHSSNSTAPGLTGTNWRLLKWFNQSCSTPYILSFINASIQLGYLPPSLRTGIIVMIPKQNKPDYTLPKSYRPITLIENLSKLIEKIIATRLLYDIRKHQLIPTTQYGGHNHSSPLDGGLTLVHDIHSIWKQGRVATFIALDISGFFNNINHERLQHQLYLLGFPIEITCWITSFIHNRTVQFRIDNELSDIHHTGNIGIPQGSPLSPVLSTIYTSPILHRLTSLYPDANLYSYVDDLSILAAGPTLEISTHRAEHTANLAWQTLHDIGLDIGHDKIDATHFYRTRKHHPIPHITITPPNSPPITVPPSQHLRWLGFYFDSHLTFKHHVYTMARRATTQAIALRMLTNTICGLNIYPARHLYTATILPILTYGAPLYYNAHRQQTLIRPITLAQNQSLRWLLGAFCTTPISSLETLSAILPIPIYLQRLNDTTAIRLRTLPTQSQPLQ